MKIILKGLPGCPIVYKLFTELYTLTVITSREDFFVDETDVATTFGEFCFTYFIQQILLFVEMYDK